ncbi:hypothetical protein QBC34DRAFT_477655 [Podospora aff. communis PSN243]|uniref:Uncharacterized protein n=1 Tax=Podospora aff. communis PSN243 TaxID=3040156 RepID=A0AAV9G539_9PEZI|nr:hypothetical protein QBC34DRAFT_477655 [Podospora aff. communis PSN243]
MSSTENTEILEFSWREASPGAWQRDIDEIEKFYSALIRLYSGTGRMEFAITGHLSVTVPIDALNNETATSTAARLENALRAAWLWLRNDNPTIASRVCFDKALGKYQKRYEVAADKAARTEWLNKTFIPISSGQTGAEWANSDPPAPRYATLFVIEPPAADSSVVRRDLVLRSPHDIIDGIGTLQLFDNLIAHVSRINSTDNPNTLPPLDGSETTRLSPPYRAAAAVPTTPTPSQQARLAAMEQSKTTPRTDDNIPDLSIPFLAGPTLPGKHQRVSLTVSPTRTARLLAALKPLHATLTHAFHTTIALVVRDITSALHSPHHPHVRYVNYILRNERSHCTPPFNTPSHAAAVYHSVSGGRLEVEMSSSPSADPVSEFETVLAKMRAYYLSVRDDPEHYALAPYISTGLTPNVDPDEEVDIPVPAPNAKPSVSLSSMGVVDRIIAPQRGVVRVDAPWVTGEELGTGLGLFLGTFRGVLELSAAYNEAWHGREEVQGFLERCERVVFGWVDVVAGREGV